jgi:hypothetical protein
MTWHSDRGGVVARALRRVNQARRGVGGERLTVMTEPAKDHCQCSCEIRSVSRARRPLMSTDSLNVCSEIRRRGILLTHGFISIFLRNANCGSNTNTLCGEHGEGVVSSKGIWFARIQSHISPPDRSPRRRLPCLRREKHVRRPRSRPNFSATRERSRRVESFSGESAKRFTVLRPSGRMKVWPLCFCRLRMQACA